MKTLPSISAHIDENVINKIIQDNFAALAPSFFYLNKQLVYQSLQLLQRHR